MKLNFLIVAGLISGIIIALFLPRKALAAMPNWPKLKIDYTARNLTTGSSWEENLQANAGDTLELKAILSDIEPGTTIRNIKISVPLAHENYVLHPRFYLLSYNAGALNSEVSIGVQSKSLVMNYITGTSRLSFGGSTRGISPDTSSANITTQLIPIGDIPYGDSNAITITYQVQMVDAQKKAEVSASASNAVAEGAIGGSDIASTSAVASSNPEAGIGDGVWWPTLRWLVVGVAGIGLKKWGVRIWEQTLM